MMTELKGTPTRAELVETHRKFHDLAKESYPDVGEPGAVWVLAEVLGWPMERITRVAVDGFDKTQYRLFLLDSDDKRMVKRDAEGKITEVVKVTRKWTSEEKSKLKDWWWLLGF